MAGFVALSASVRQEAKHENLFVLRACGHCR